MNHLYALSLVASIGNKVTHYPAYTLASSIEEAVGIGLRAIKKKCPSKKGYTDHDCVAVEIPNELTDSLAKPK